MNTENKTPPTGPAAVEELARTFARKLREEIGGDKLALVVVRNRGTDARSGCASHDFCDSNMTMAEAFEEVFSIEPDVDDDDDTDLWNEAWAMAKGADFWLTDDPPSTEIPGAERAAALAHMRRLADQFDRVAYHYQLRAEALRGAARIGAEFNDSTRARLENVIAETVEVLAKDEPGGNIEAAIRLAADIRGGV